MFKGGDGGGQVLMEAGTEFQRVVAVGVKEKRLAEIWERGTSPLYVAQQRSKPLHFSMKTPHVQY